MSNLAIPNALANATAADATEVDANFDAIQLWADTYVVEKGGATMTGALVLSGDPAVALGAATKQYVDNLIPVAKFSRTTNFNVAASTDSDVSFEAETGDDDGWWAVASPTVFTCPADGLYVISATAVQTTSASPLLLYFEDTTGSFVAGFATTIEAASRAVDGGVYYIPAAHTFKVRISNGDGVDLATIDSVDLVIARLGLV